MAAGHVSASSLDNLNFLVKCVDTNTIKSLKDKAHLIYEGNRIKWTQDLDSLKYFIENIVGLNGRWRSPGGKSKQFNSINADLSITWYPGNQNSLLFQGKDGIVLKDFVVKMLEEPNIDSPNSNAKFSTQTADPVAEPCEKLCEIVADTKAAIEPELYVSSHHTCDCNPCGNDIKNVKLDIEDFQKQISSINNVIDSTNGIIESISEILLPGDGGGLTHDRRTESMVNELFKIIDEKNKVIMDRDNIIRELRTKLSEAESERDSLKQQEYSLDTQDTFQCNDTIENQRSLSSKTIPIEETTGTRHENNTDISLNNGKSYVSDSNSALQNIPVPAITTLKALTTMSHALSKTNPENWLGKLPLLEGKHKASCTLKSAKQNISQTSTMKTTDARMTSNAIKTPIQPM